MSWNKLCMLNIMTYHNKKLCSWMMIRHFLRSMTLNCFMFFLLFTTVFANETLVLKKNTLLLRNKRYLSFPASSNFQVCLACFLLMAPY